MSNGEREDNGQTQRHARKLTVFVSEGKGCYDLIEDFKSLDRELRVG